MEVHVKSTVVMKPQ